MDFYGMLKHSIEFHIILQNSIKTYVYSNIPKIFELLAARLPASWQGGMGGSQWEGVPGRRRSSCRELKSLWNIGIYKGFYGILWNYMEFMEYLSIP